MTFAFATGFVASISLIMAIGAQNAFVFRQGLRQEHVFWLCMFCATSDAILITLGVLGFGAMVQSYPGLPAYLAIGGAAFLFVYGAMRFWSAWQGGQTLEANGNSRTLLATLTIAGGFTWLNPHVYLDTVGLLGAISTSFDGMDKTAFGLGAVSASFVFFFSLGYGSRLLAPLMESQRAWMVTDFIIGVLMWWLAFGLIAYL